MPHTHTHIHTHTHTLPDDASDAESICDSTPLQDILLTAADILDLKLPVKLVVLGSVCVFVCNDYVHVCVGTYMLPFRQVVLTVCVHVCMYLLWMSLCVSKCVCVCM